jgi:hypothetical protein
MSFLLGEELFDTIEDFLPGDNPVLDFVGDVVTPGDGNNPIMDFVTGEAGRRQDARRNAAKPGTAGGTGGCPLDCYQTCQAKNQKIDEQARLSIDNFYKTMKERGVTITGCKVRPTGKVCSMRKARAKKTCAPKRKTCGYKPKPKCGCNK